MKKRLSPVQCFFILSSVAVIFFSLSSDLPRRQGGGFFSDEASYYSITQSLAYDGDLEYTHDDIVRIKERFWVGPTGLFLKKAKNGSLYFAKSFIYPLFVAPFFRLFDTRGFPLFNGLLLILSLLMAYRLLSRFHPPEKSFAFSLIVLFSSVAWVYVLWMQPDFFNYFMMFAGLFFFFYPFRRTGWFYLAGFFFAVAIFSKPSNLAPVGVVTLILLFRRQWKKFLALGLIMAAILAAVLFFNYSQTGEWNFMGGERKSFAGKFPLEKKEYGFDSADTATTMTADTYWQRFSLTPAVAVMNLFYYFFGRFTGMLIYFPAALFLLLLFFFQKKTPEDWFLLAAIAAGILALVWITPDNYFGGSGSLGNRYFLSLFPLFFFLGHRNRNFSFSILPLALAALFLTPVFLDPLFHSYTPRTVGTHFPASLFPIEKTQFYTLPSNENPRAFYRSVGQRYWLFFTNDNFHDLEGDFYWTYGDHPSEFLLLAPQKVKEFRIELSNNPLPNIVHLQIEGMAKRYRLGPRERLTLTFKGIASPRMFRRYLYSFRIRSSRYFSPSVSEEGSSDNRLLLGVKVRIDPVY